MCGHHACNVWTDTQDVRGVGHLQACLELRSDSGIYWSCPETLWSVLIGAWAYPFLSSGGLGPAQHVELLPPLVGGPHSLGPAVVPNTTELGLSGQETAVGLLGRANFLSTKAEIA